MRRLIPLTVFLGAVAACAPARDMFAERQVGYVADPATRVADLDWAQARTVTVALDEYDFGPTLLTFREGVPYRLEIRNVGEATHYFVSDGFFKAIAAHRLERPEGAVETPYLRSIAVPAGATKVLEFVPVQAGSYALECTAPLHAIFGMTGRIRIN